jgi:hypothetical protein
MEDILVSVKMYKMYEYKEMNKKQRCKEIREERND